MVTGLSSILSESEELQGGGNVPVVSGNYKPLTLWDSISLGASYYSNPERVKTTSVAYSFDGPEFSGKPVALWNFAQQGRISFGISDKDKKQILVVPLSELQKRYNVNGPDDLIHVLTKDDVMVVFADKTLLGEDSKTLVVKTESRKDVK